MRTSSHEHHDLAERTADGAERSRRIANDTFDSLSHAVEAARHSAIPAIERLGASAESLARRSIDLARARSALVRAQAHRASEQTVGYIRDEPLKSVLIAAAVGATVALVWSLFTHRPDRSDRRR